MKQGFNVIEDKELKKHGINNCEKISIIEMLRRTEKEQLEQWEDYCVKGLETLMIENENYEELSNYLNNLLEGQINFLNKKVNTFQLEINTDKANIEDWGKPCIVPKNKEKKHSLFEIFNHIEMEEDNPNWYYSQLTLKS